MSRSVVLKSFPPVFNVLLKQAVNSFNLKLALLKTDQKMGVIVIMKFTSDFSHYFQSLGHLNVVPTDHQRVIGSPAPAAIRKMNEKHRKKKLVSHNEIICTEYSVQIFANVLRTVANGFETSRPTPVLVNSPRLPSPLATTTTTKMTTTMISSRYKETLSSTLER